MAKCSELNCDAWAIKGQAKCFMHSDDPEIVTKRKEAKSRGGKKGKQAIELKKRYYNLDDLKFILSSEIHNMISSSTDSVISRGRAVAYVSKTLAEIIAKSDFELRLAALEERIFSGE